MSGLVDHSKTPAAGEAPAGGDEPTRPASSKPGLRERGQIRRRVRFLRKLRELQLRDLGGFMVEQHRLGHENPRVVRDKLAGAAATDRELRTLERALEERRPLRGIREPGVGGACPDCGTVHGSADRFCSWCGRTL